MLASGCPIPPRRQPQTPRTPRMSPSRLSRLTQAKSPKCMRSRVLLRDGSSRKNMKRHPQHLRMDYAPPSTPTDWPNQPLSNLHCNEALCLNFQHAIETQNDQISIRLPLKPQRLLDFDDDLSGICGSVRRSRRWKNEGLPGNL